MLNYFAEYLLAGYFDGYLPNKEKSEEFSIAIVYSATESDAKKPISLEFI